MGLCWSGLGSLARRHGDHSVYLLPTSWRIGLQTRYSEITYGLERLASYIQEVES